MRGNSAKVFESSKFPKLSGKVTKAFSNFAQTEFILMFEDLSMRFIKDGAYQWTIDQAIAKVDKVEIFDSSNMPTETDDTDPHSAANMLSYVRNMGDRISIADVPVRIV